MRVGAAGTARNFSGSDSYCSKHNCLASACSALFPPSDRLLHNAAMDRLQNIPFGWFVPISAQFSMQGSYVCFSRLVHIVDTIHFRACRTAAPKCTAGHNSRRANFLCWCKSQVSVAHVHRVMVPNRHGLNLVQGRASEGKDVLPIQS